MNWLTKISFPAMDTSVPIISPQEAYNTCFPETFYHGTTPDLASDIIERGFIWNIEEAGQSATRHGYENFYYGQTGCKSPVHHLGFGIYLTSSRTNAKRFGDKVLQFKILKTAKIITLNKGSPNTMAAWWQEWGYDCELSKKDRVQATKIMTDKISAQYQAAYFLGKGLYRRLLDGNQICIYDPSILRQINSKLAKSREIGSKVIKIKEISSSKIPIGSKGTLLEYRPIDEEMSQKYHFNEPAFLTVKWEKGGTEMNVYPGELKFL